MAVHNIECQIAKSQIGRYLSGDAFSPQALKQLEEHVAECSECKVSLHQRKAALQAMLGDSNTAVVQVDETETETHKTFAETLRGKMSSKPRPTQTAVPETKPVHFWKPLGYSLALAAVLLGMSAFSKTLTSPFGAKVEATPDTATAPATNSPSSASTGSPATVAASTNTSNAVTSTETKPADKPVSTDTTLATGAVKPADDTAKPSSDAKTPDTKASEVKPVDAKPTETKAAETKPTVTKSPEAKTPPTPAPVFTLPNKPAHKLAAKPAPVKPKAHKAKHRRVTKAKAAAHRRAKKNRSAIRVYDPSGNLIANK